MYKSIVRRIPSAMLCLGAAEYEPQDGRAADHIMVKTISIIVDRQTLA